MEQTGNNCPICNTNMDSLGIGKFCKRCGYAHIESPMAEYFKKKARTKIIIIVVVIALIGWVIPQILLSILQ